jgi:hypothetical protein
MGEGWGGGAITSPTSIIRLSVIFPCRALRGKKINFRAFRVNACPPQVQHAGMPVAGGFLARRFFVDGIQRQGDFDQLLAVG